MSADRRKNTRRLVRQIGTMLNTDGSILGECLMSDVSKTGARLRLQNSIELPDRFTLLLSRNGRVRRQCSVIWRSENALGVQFLASAVIKPK
jgi:PilZ domain